MRFHIFSRSPHTHTVVEGLLWLCCSWATYDETWGFSEYECICETANICRGLLCRSILVMMIWLTRCRTLRKWFWILLMLLFFFLYLVNGLSDRFGGVCVLWEDIFVCVFVHDKWNIPRPITELWSCDARRKLYNACTQTNRHCWHWPPASQTPQSRPRIWLPQMFKCVSAILNRRCCVFFLLQ